MQNRRSFPKERTVCCLQGRLPFRLDSPFIQNSKRGEAKAFRRYTEIHRRRLRTVLCKSVKQWGLSIYVPLYADKSVMSTALESAVFVKMQQFRPFFRKKPQKKKPQTANALFEGIFRILRKSGQKSAEKVTKL